MIDLIYGDCMDKMKQIPDGSVDLVLTDPPYNIGVTTQVSGEKMKNSWDKIDNYIDWCVEWILECQRVLKLNGVMYFFHNDILQISEILHEMMNKTMFKLRSFCVWDKGDSYRAQTWKNRRPDGKTALRSWFNICEYCMHFYKTINENNYSLYIKPFNDWYCSELSRLGITERDVKNKYTNVTGKKPYMLRHYFKLNQFEIPTREIWEKIYEPLGFRFPGGKTNYENLKTQYEIINSQCRKLLPTHNCDHMHCNIWHVKSLPTNHRYHTCQKPVDILRRLIRVSSNPGDIVLDPFMGSGSTGVACLEENRNFIGIEKDEKYYQVACDRIFGD